MSSTLLINSAEVRFTFETDLKITFAAEADGPEQRGPDVGTVLVRVPEFDEPDESEKTWFRMQGSSATTSFTMYQLSLVHVLF